MINGYEEFVEEFRQLLLAVTGYEDERIFFKREREEPVTDGDRLFMVCSENRDAKEVCGLHTRDLYAQFREGIPMEILLKEVLEQIQTLKKNGVIGKVLQMDTYEKVKDSLCIRLLNVEKYRWDLENAIYRTIGDIALVLYMKIAQNNGVLTTMKIRKPMLEDWGADANEAFEAALLNTYYQSPPRIYPWKKWLLNPKYEGEVFMDLLSDYHMSRGPMGNCLSTSAKTNGAVAIFLPGVADRIATLLDSDFYMVFTSIHEVMIHREEDAEPDNLRRVLRDTVEEATPDEDFLTYKIFHYDRFSRKFTVVN